MSPEITERRVIMQARGLVKRYGSVTAINGADFDLHDGEVLAVIGDNGAGKSSMIRALTAAPSRWRARRSTSRTPSMPGPRASKPSTRTLP